MAGPRPLPLIVEQAPAEGACCAACAGTETTAAPAAATPEPAPRPVTRARPVLPVLTPGRPPLARQDDRRITFAGLGLAVLLLSAAVASLLLPAIDRRGLWLPLHLGLAGAAGTAVAAVLPFFTAALAVARPARPWLRIGAIGMTGGGAIAVSAGVAANVSALAVAGGGAYLVGLAALAGAAFVPLRGALGPRRRLVERAYAAAIAQICVGVAIATALVAGATPVVERWAQLKPAHAWLNVLGFLTVIVAATLIHLGPTVAGTRIRPRRSAAIAVIGLVSGPPLVAAGFAFASDPVARTGAVAALVGAVGLVVHAAVVMREGSRWTTDLAWHRFTIASLTAAPVWLLVALGLAAGPVLSIGAVPAAWRIETVAAPLAIGWLAQVLTGSWSHLLPAIGPGDMAVHAGQRRILGRAGALRFVALNAGVAAAVGGTMLSTPALSIAGALVAVSALAASLVLFARAALADWLAAGSPPAGRARAEADQPVAVSGGG